MEDDKKIVSKEMQDEMIGVLTAISIVSGRLARRLSKLTGKEGQSNEEEEKT